VELPYNDADPIMRLMVHYFEPADLMYKHYQTLSREWDSRGRLSHNKKRDMRNFVCLWLSVLYVVSDGFQSEKVQAALVPFTARSQTLRMHCGSVLHQLGQLGDRLRVFRNASFHYQDTHRKHLVFLHAEGSHRPILWATDLHKEFQMLFSEYRIEALVAHYYWDRQEKPS
jgi:hypothetical protein